jgi:hypothetical protein
VTAGVLVLSGLTWTAMKAVDRLRDRYTSASGTPGSSATSSSAPGSGTGSGRSDEASNPSPTAPQPEPHPQVWLDEDNSMAFKKPVEPKNNKGDIRFSCKKNGCALESDTSAIQMVYSEKPGATLDTCRSVLTGSKNRDLPLAAAAAGSEICLKGPSGDIALLVVQVKSTALWDKPGISFLLADVTIWRNAA